jgi:hypothetical protein
MRLTPRSHLTIAVPRGIFHLVSVAALSVALWVAVSPSAPLAQSCTGTETVLVQSGASMRYRANSAPDDISLVEFETDMKFLANTNDPGITGVAWTAEGYPDTGWLSGTYGVGYDTDPTTNALALIHTTVPNQTFSVYTRARFTIATIADLAGINSIFIGADYDDGYVAWVNGVEVFRSPEMPAGTPVWNTNTALHESSNATTPNYGNLVDITGLALPVLHTGVNVLAVGVWNSAAATSTDLVVVPKLSFSPDWTRADFDDSVAPWAGGNYGVGYDTNATVNALALISTLVPTNTMSVFTRTPFTIADKSTVQKLFIGADYDDGYVAWINGVEVFGSAEMPIGRLPWTVPAVLHESSNGTAPNYGTLHDISARGVPALRDGLNVLAVGVWNDQASPQSTDLLLVPRLSSGEADPCNGVDDNCNGLVDEGYPNFDHDALADCVDLDDDNDGIADTADCAPFDPANSTPPVLEVKDLQWVRSDVRTNLLSWRDQGAGVRYDLASGLVSALRPDGGVGGALCLADNVASAAYDDSRPAPPRGDEYYYLVRAEKPPTCGTGSYGLASSGVPRVPVSDCP